MAELQTIPARHGVATFVPAGQVIKIINTSGTQVIDTWAFALPAPDGKKGETKDDTEEPEQPKQSPAPVKSAPKKLKKGSDFPSQEDAEKATKDGLALGEKAEKDAADAKAQKSGWSSYVPTSYVPSLGFGSSKKENEEPKKETQQQKNSRTWASYFPSGKGFSSYIPKQATDTVSQFAASHQRDPSKSYLEQLQDFSKTPVGAAGLKAMTGSGYSGSLYAGYNAWNAMNAAHGQMEFMSMAHTHTATLHLRPQVNDTLVTNLREPILTLIEDTSPGIHDTLIAACDPQRYKSLGVNKWEEHGSCAENLVLALKELNQRAGLKGTKAVGADVTINSVPAPLNLFMNIPWDDAGDLGFHAPKTKAGDYVRFKAERDVVIVLSACPQDVVDINNRQPTDAQFIVEDHGEDVTAALKRTQPAKRTTVPPRKKPVPRQQAAANGAAKSSTDAPTTVKKNPVPSTKPPPPKKVPAQNATTKAPQSTPAQPVKQPTTTTARPKKKPIPPAVTPSNTNDEGTAPVEKKRPRKLPPKAKPAAA